MNKNHEPGKPVPGYRLEMLSSNMSRGLHAVAQPLTILRASLSPDLTGRMSTHELRQLTASSAIEVERVCTLFSCMQQIVTAERLKPRLSATPILPLLADAADGVNLLFEHDGMLLTSVVPDRCQQVLINGARTLQALSNVLLIAHTVSRAPDTIELIASCSSSNAVRVIVQNPNSRVDRMDEESTLSMALAEVNIRSQQAGFSWQLNPFNVQIELQKAPLGQSS